MAQPVPVYRRIVILGNAGVGKTFLARALAAAHNLPVLHLDQLFWAGDDFSVKRSAADVHVMIDDRLADEDWIVEGVFGELAERFLPSADCLLWLDLGWHVCRDSLVARHKAIPATERNQALEESFQRLLIYAGDYWQRTDGRSHAGHQRLFDAFSGPKRCFTQRADVQGFIATDAPFH